MTKVIFVHGAFASGTSWFDVPALATAPRTGDRETYTGEPITLRHHVPLFSRSRFAVLIRKLGDGDFDLQNLLGEVDGFVPGGSLDDYAEDIASAFPADRNEKCILVGHSLGGMAISAAAAKYPDRIKKLVYVTALLPRDGDSADALLGTTLSDPKIFFKEVLELKPRGFFRLLAVLTKQPQDVLSDRFAGNAEFEALAKHYVMCTDDGMIPLAKQQIMAGTLPARTLASIHFPQITEPGKLADILHDILEENA